MLLVSLSSPTTLLLPYAPTAKLLVMTCEMLLLADVFLSAMAMCDDCGLSTETVFVQVAYARSQRFSTVLCLGDIAWQHGPAGLQPHGADEHGPPTPAA